MARFFPTYYFRILGFGRNCSLYSLLLKSNAVVIPIVCTDFSVVVI